MSKRQAIAGAYVRCISSFTGVNALVMYHLLGSYHADGPPYQTVWYIQQLFVFQAPGFFLQTNGQSTLLSGETSLTDLGLIPTTLR